LADVLSPKYWKQNFKNGEFFRNKIVFVGPTADIFQDAHLTPFPEENIVINGTQVHAPKMMSGPEIHLNMIAAALNRTFLRDATLAHSLMIIVLAGLFATALSFRVHQPLRRLAAIIVLVVIYWFWAQWTFDHANVVVPVASPVLVLTISGVFVLTYDYFVQLFERTRVRRTLERYVSKNIVKEVLDNPETYFNSLGGARKRVTILFSDLRGFTTLAESADSSQLVKQLNEYFEEMTRHVFQFEGTLDKFIGDAVMAVWGNIESRGLEIDAQHAVSTGLAMIQSVAKLNADWKKRGMLEFHLGIGINHGEVIAGNLGSEAKMDATVIGDAVNLASRLEGLTKYFHVELLIGETVAPLVREKFLLRTVGLIQPKGKTKPIEVFTVLGERGSINPAAMDWFAEYEEAVKLFRRRAFEEALKRFELCRGKHPDDYLATRYCAECEALLKNPPDEYWNGVFVMSEK
ncbi:MAG TPA: adenylate/guanylate cyclase domain-containing protein, partial [Verrucomicrobiae bacterium]|nr:adenylate/guanylate cyclase domain-containing protein [Verrucomicrobiae bacterium]